MRSSPAARRLTEAIAALAVARIFRARSAMSNAGLIARRLGAISAPMRLALDLQPALTSMATARATLGFTATVPGRSFAPLTAATPYWHWEERLKTYQCQQTTTVMEKLMWRSTVLELGPFCALR